LFRLIVPNPRQHCKPHSPPVPHCAHPSLTTSKPPHSLTTPPRPAPLPPRLQPSRESPGSS